METIQIIAERISGAHDPIMYSIGAVAALIAVISGIIALIVSDTSDSERSNLHNYVGLIFALLTLFCGLVAIIGQIHWAQQTEYMIQISEQTTYLEFASKYEIIEKVSETIFWCIPIK